MAIDFGLTGGEKTSGSRDSDKPSYSQPSGNYGRGGSTQESRSNPADRPQAQYTGVSAGQTISGNERGSDRTPDASFLGDWFSPQSIRDAITGTPGSAKRDNQDTANYSIAERGVIDTIGATIKGLLNDAVTFAKSANASLALLPWDDVPAIEAYTIQAAKARGIDPAIALRVGRAEGIGKGIWQSTFTNKSGKREPSFGPFQLLFGGPGTGYGKGLGNAFVAQTGLPLDKTTVRQQIDFALDYAAENGWGSWFGAARVGISDWQGLSGARAIGITPRGYNAGGAAVTPIDQNPAAPTGSRNPNAQTPITPPTKDITPPSGGTKRGSNIGLVADIIRGFTPDSTRAIDQTITTGSTFAMSNGDQPIIKKWPVSPDANPGGSGQWGSQNITDTSTGASVASSAVLPKIAGKTADALTDGKSGILGGIVGGLIDKITPFGILDGLLGGGASNAIDSAVDPLAPDILATIQEYFLRIVVIVLGLIFVAVGLSLFKTVQTVIAKAT